MRLFALLALLSYHLGAAGQTSGVDFQRDSCIQNAGALLDQALVLMQKNYYKRDSVEWEPLVQSARERVKQSADCESAAKAVQWCFDQLKEEHSFVMPAAKAAMYNGNINSSERGSTSKPLFGKIFHEILDDDIAYINVPWIATTDKALCTAFADSLQSIIRQADKMGITKWIVDLRRNTGGNCWPMLAGLGPLLGNGVHGYFVSSKETIPISYKDGASMQGRYARCVVNNPYTLSNNKKTVIVLTGKKTSSAGEIIALSFRGLPNVYLYGEPTAGLTTANASYPLSDGSLLVLTVGKEADRNGRIVEGSIQPDELISSITSADKDHVKDAAVMFLQLQ